MFTLHVGAAQPQAILPFTPSSALSTACAGFRNRAPSACSCHNSWRRCAGVSVFVRSFWDWTLYHPLHLPWDKLGASKAGRPDAALPMNAQQSAFAAIPDVMTQYRKPTQANAHITPAAGAPQALPPQPSGAQLECAEVPCMAAVYKRCSQAATDAIDKLSELTRTPREQLCSEDVHANSAVPFKIGAHAHCRWQLVQCMLQSKLYTTASAGFCKVWPAHVHCAALAPEC
jgi:hypothetical protein